MLYKDILLDKLLYYKVKNDFVLGRVIEQANRGKIVYTDPSSEVIDQRRTRI